jgi:hypothetical protein
VIPPELPVPVHEVVATQRVGRKIILRRGINIFVRSFNEGNHFQGSERVVIRKRILNKSIKKPIVEKYKKTGADERVEEKNHWKIISKRLHNYRLRFVLQIRMR